MKTIIDGQKGTLTRNNRFYSDEVMRNLWGKGKTPDDVTFNIAVIKESLTHIHSEGYRLTIESYINIIKKNPEWYELLPNDVKCQELELVLKIS